MIEEYLRPLDISQALEMASAHYGESVWFSGGSKINATPTQSPKTVAISLENLQLDHVKMDGVELTIGAMCRIQQLIDHEATPKALKEASAFIYSRHIRNQATIGGEIASRQEESALLSCLIALNAKLVLANHDEVTVEQYRGANQSELIVEVIIPDAKLVCATRKIARSAAGLNVLTAAVSLARTGEKRIVVDGLSPQKDGSANPLRATEIESQSLEAEELEQAVSKWVTPVEDIRGSVEYKRYISGVVIADLVAECHQLSEEEYCD